MIATAEKSETGEGHVIVSYSCRSCAVCSKMIGEWLSWYLDTTLECANRCRCI